MLTSVLKGDGATGLASASATSTEVHDHVAQEHFPPYKYCLGEERLSFATTNADQHVVR